MSNREWNSRPLTEGETAIAFGIFGNHIESGRIRVLRRKFAFFQAPHITMAPDGNIWLHPESNLAQSGVADDFSKASASVRAHFVHEMTHVWQHQNGVNLVLEKFLMFFRHGALGGYGYELVPGKSFESYNIEQQACIVADAYLARCSGEATRNAKLLEMLWEAGIPCLSSLTIPPGVVSSPPFSMLHIGRRNCDISH